jgi:hypothetical protein
MLKKLFFLLFLFLIGGLWACDNQKTTTTVTISSTPTTSQISLNDQEVLQMVLEQIEIPEIIEDDIELPTIYLVQGYEVVASWHSTASNTINSQGKVTPNVSDRQATLTVTLTYNEASLNKSFNVTVKGNEAFLLLFAVLNNRVQIPTDKITEDIDLPTEYQMDGKYVIATWTSSNEAALSSTGEVTLIDQDVTITLSLVLSYQGITKTQTYTIVVGQDPTTLPENSWHLSEVYHGVIPNESLKPSLPNCFAGAVYRKVVSSKDFWIGIEATITLPEFFVDQDRYDDEKANYYLDNASIYMGGHAYFESDVGIAWMIGHEDEYSSRLSRSGIAYRPFWRYITTQEVCTNNNCYRNASVSNYELYYFPGDKLRISVYSPKPGYMQMRIEVLETTTHPDYINKRDEYGLPEDFNRIFVTPIFPSAGMGELKAEFKRVNAIDQVANEGKPTINTNASVVNAIWHEVYLYRKIDDILYKVPMTNDRSVGMICPLGQNVNGDFSNAFIIDYEGVDVLKGGEIVTLNPNNGTGRLYNLFIYLNRKEEYEL